MSKKLFTIAILAFTVCIINGCVKEAKEAVDEANSALKCANSVKDLDKKNEANPDRSCDAIIADINEIEKTCKEYLSKSNKEAFALLREKCQDN